MSEERNHNRQYTLTDIEQYLQGKLSPAEMHELEKAAVQDPFLADAIEGYQSSDLLQAKEDLTEIQKRLLQEEREDPKAIPIASQKNGWWKIAAVIILLAGIGTLGWKFLIGPNTKQELAQQPAHQIQKDSASSALAKVIKKDTPVQKADLVADVVPKPKPQSLKKNIPVTAMAQNARPVTTPSKYFSKDTTLLSKNAQTYTYDNGSYLAGKVAGISVQQENKMLSVKPERDVIDLARRKELADQINSAPIRIRGNSSAEVSPSPLYVIDGTKIRSIPDLATIDPSYIKSITVLKKEEAMALYGRDGENGAVVITSNNFGLIGNLTVAGNITGRTFNDVLPTRVQPDITNLGGLNNLTVTGSLNVGVFSGTLSAANEAYKVIRPSVHSVPGTITGGVFSGTLGAGTLNNITSLGNLSALTVNGILASSDSHSKPKSLHIFSGKVIDAKTAKPIPYASITLEKTNQMIAADANGNFNFGTNDTIQKISIAALGFEQKDILAKTSRPNEVLMSESSATLNEVVVTGYGTTRKRDITGSVTKISPQSNETIPEGGWDPFRNYLKKKINNLTQKEQRAVQHGSVTVELTLKDGKVRNAAIIKTFNESFNKTLIQAIKQGPRWTSSIKPGRKEKRTVNFAL